MIKSSRRILTCICSIASVHWAQAQGVMIHDASTGDLLHIDASHVTVNIEDQVALVTSMQRFSNATSDTLDVKYGYPLGSTASATRLRWMSPDSIWHVASMAAQPQDTTLPGVGGGTPTDADLEEYLGSTPLYFDISDPIPPGSWMNVELSYVELLPYANAHVEMRSASDYSLVVNGSLPEVTIDVSVRSQRDITGIEITGLGAWSPPTDAPYLSNDSASIHVDDLNVPTNCGFAIGYDLDPSAYGLISLSNYLPDSLVKCDGYGNGFFVLLIEPEPASDIVDKDFMIVIDKSGSMSGTKIMEARDAASFMVNNLNPGDAFNVITFNDAAYPWNADLQPATAANVTSALSWIGQVGAGGGTNINSSITMGIQDFSTSTPGHARVMVFLTDGVDSQPNPVILNNALQLRQSIAPDLQIFTFGIGSGYNEQLLNQLAVQNNGVSQFLETANFSQVMSDFYLQIQNPTLLNPTATFDHPDVEQTYPDPLLGLFVGQQMAIVGRYDVPGPTNLHLDGFASGNPVSFDFSFDLAGTFDENKLFVTKIWAQKAVDALVNEYYSYPDGSSEAETIRDSIVNYSMCHGIGSPFTSFTDNGGGGAVGLEEELATEPIAQIAFPTPADRSAPVTFDLGAFRSAGLLTLRIFDALGQLVLEVDLSNFAGSTWVWNGLDKNGVTASGQFIYRISSDHDLASGQVVRL